MSGPLLDPEKGNSGKSFTATYVHNGDPTLSLLPSTRVRDNYHPDSNNVVTTFPLGTNYRRKDFPSLDCRRRSNEILNDGLFGVAHERAGAHGCRNHCCSSEAATTSPAQGDGTLMSATTTATTLPLSNQPRSPTRQQMEQRPWPTDMRRAP